jgi:serine/threonine protein kinase/tetratricopeptide (TPR) repeat protein
MTDAHHGDDPLDALTEEFARRWREGERPTVEEYVERYPQWAEEIRAALPGVVLMEQLKPRREQGASTGSPTPHPNRPPERVGEYHIVREVGRGGMGVVYEAEQETLGRRVALKVLPRHLLANDKLHSRFRRESQAAARLHHTNIVPVFGVGESEEFCYYAMQLIAGAGLDQVIQAAGAETDHTGPARGNQPAESHARTDPASPNGNGAAPGPARHSALVGASRRDFCRTAARIGVQVAEALAYAHTQGVLHRDIKPSNLLLDTGGCVWVTDFGVAKLVEEANLTQSGELVGTLKYMPPEQFSGHSDARGDIYSLGITLYELLALQAAFPDTTPQHLIQLITQDALPPLRKMRPDVPRDLETIVLKAAARDPGHRYQSAGELADDLRRFLDDRPIRARRAGPLEQTWRWCRRKPALAAATAIAFLLMVAITVVSVVAYAQTEAANRATANALAAEKGQREYAEGAATLALEALNRIYTRFAPTRLVVTPQSANDQGVELPPQPALPPEAVSLLEDLLHTYEQIAQSAGRFPRLQAQAAEASYRIGDIRQRLGQSEAAVAAYRTAIDLYARLLPDPGEDAVRIKLARTCNEMGRTLRSLQQLDEADRMYERTMQTLHEAPPELAARPECRYELARASFMFGQRDQFVSPRGLPGDPPPRPGEPGRGPPGHRREPPPPRPGEPGRGPPGFGREPPPPPDRPPPGLGPRPDGEHPAQRAATLLEELVRDFPAVPEYRHLLACCYRDTPPERFGRGELRGISNNDRAIELLKQLVVKFPRVPDYRLDLCETLTHTGPPERPRDGSPDSRKREQLGEAVTLSAALVADYPNVPDYANAHARSLNQLGIALFQAARAEEAEKLLRKAVTVQAKLVKLYPEVVAYGLWLGLMERSLGRVLSERGAWQEARTQLESAVERMEALRKKNTRLTAVRPYLGIAYRDLAQALTGAGEKALAAAAQRKSEELEPERGRDPFAPRPRGNGRP